MDRLFYYVFKKFKYNGNDVHFINESTHENFTYNCDLDKAKLFTFDEAVALEKTGEYQKIIAQEAQRIACYHAPAGKIRREQIADGDICLKVSKRDQCGKNAAYWYFNNNGYGSDYRCAQVYKYQEGMRERDFEFYIKLSKVIKVSEKRVDIQDVQTASERMNHHSILYTAAQINLKKETGGLWESH